MELDDREGLLKGMPIGGVPVIPNGGLVTGEIEGIKMYSEGDILNIRVLDSEDMGKMANFVANEVGKTIKVLVGGCHHLSLKPGDIIELPISYEGDERGGGYLASGRNLSIRRKRWKGR